MIRFVRVGLAPAREVGIRTADFVDDYMVIGSTPEECLRNTIFVMELLTDLGWKINWEKSILVPTQRLKFLGLIVDSKEMVFDVPKEKLEKYTNSVKRAAAKFKKEKRISKKLLQRRSDAFEVLCSYFHSLILLVEVAVVYCLRSIT